MTRFHFFLFTLISFFCATAHASIFRIDTPHPRGPLATRTQNPLYLQFVAQPMEMATTLSKNKFAFDLSTTFTNFFDRNIKANGVGVDLDMELWRTALQANYGITHRITLGVELPFLSTSGGFLDSFVQDYHNAFGFPNAGRDDVDNGRFSFKLTRNGSTVYDADETRWGLSDIPLNFKFNFFDETKRLPALALKTSLKMPTGSFSKGTGSGKVDFAASLLSQKSLGRFHLYSQLGFTAFGGHGDQELNALTKKGALLYGQTSFLHHPGFRQQPLFQKHIRSRTF